MVVAEVVILRAFLVIEENASFETRKLFNETWCWSCRTWKSDGDSSQYCHYQLRHHICKLFDVTYGMIMHADIYEIWSF